MVLNKKHKLILLWAAFVLVPKRTLVPTSPSKQPATTTPVTTEESKPSTGRWSSENRSGKFRGHRDRMPINSAE